MASTSWKMFSPFPLKNLTLPNRIVLAPMGNHLQTAQGEVTDALIAYLEERARGGTGLIITPFAAVTPYHPTFGAYSDDLLPGLQQLTQRVKQHGAKIMLQIAHFGAIYAHDPVAPSSFPSRLYWIDVTPREIQPSEIQTVIEAFVSAAVRASKAGFDGVEFHGGYAYLVGEFYSPHFNRRQDAYGGSFANRMRFVDEVIQGIQAELGDDFPIGFKLNAHEHVQGGIDQQEAIRIAKHLAALGVAYIHVVSNFRLDDVCEYSGLPPMYDEIYGLVDLAGQIKQEVDVPIMATGGVVMPDQAEQILQTGKADLVAIGRGLIAEPDWVKRVQQGHALRACLKCNVCHIKEVLNGEEVRCTVNPRAGVEHSTPFNRAKTPKRLAILGGGPAGMEAALVAAQRGHQVSLFEQFFELGGKMALASLLPFKKSVKNFIEEFKRMILDHPSIQVSLDHPVAASDLSDLGADAVICAVGAKPVLPAIPGLAMSRNVLTATDLLAEIRTQPDLDDVSTYLVLGAGLVGSELAWYLKRRGKTVTLVD
ncbi:FAD-dependent oxidoreductase, partial [candidate division KSB3 bacterium]|nr:FAD-dependent oxidoreductase [candidate division KSB3 bacterium]MBD3324197.1 FAD-dependent oxidoreductase [candidate division KSB3 bacterium]